MLVHVCGLIKSDTDGKEQQKREKNNDGEGRERILDYVYSSSLPLGINSSPRIT